MFEFTFGLNAVNVFVLRSKAAPRLRVWPPAVVKLPPKYNLLLFRFNDKTVLFNPALKDVIQLPVMVSKRAKYPLLCVVVIVFTVENWPATYTWLLKPTISKTEEFKDGSQGLGLSVLMSTATA